MEKEYKDFVIADVTEWLAPLVNDPTKRELLARELVDRVERKVVEIHERLRMKIWVMRDDHLP